MYPCLLYRDRGFAFHDEKSLISVWLKVHRERSHMPGIKFNSTTKEIEIKGPESFIEPNFYRIRDLLTENLGVKKKKVSRRTKADEEPILFVDIKESQTTEVMEVPEVFEEPEKLLATEPGILAVSQEPKVKRPPVRKYIREGAKSINTEPIGDHIKQLPKRISFASLKEVFGLSEQQVGVIIRDAERQGRIRKDMDGSYAWL
jgi:hypothetical protein